MVDRKQCVLHSVVCLGRVAQARAADRPRKRQALAKQRFIGARVTGLRGRHHPRPAQIARIPLVQCGRLATFVPDHVEPALLACWRAGIGHPEATPRRMVGTRLQRIVSRDTTIHTSERSWRLRVALRSPLGLERCSVTTILHIRDAAIVCFRPPRAMFFPYRSVIGRALACVAY